MKIFLINNVNEAMQIKQLLKLNSECAKLHWSKTITDIPTNVISSLETLESFVEERVYEVCTEKTCVNSLTEDEEKAVISLLRKNSELRETLGVGVVMAGEEADRVNKLLEGKNVPKALHVAINSGRNVVLF